MVSAEADACDALQDTIDASCRCHCFEDSDPDDNGLDIDTTCMACKFYAGELFYDMDVNKCLTLNPKILYFWLGRAFAAWRSLLGGDKGFIGEVLSPEPLPAVPEFPFPEDRYQGTAIQGPSEEAPASHQFVAETPLSQRSREDMIGAVSVAVVSEIMERTSRGDGQELRQYLRRCGMVPVSEGKWKQFFYYLHLDVEEKEGHRRFIGDINEMLQMAFETKYGDLERTDDLGFDDNMLYERALDEAKMEERGRQQQAHMSIINRYNSKD